jgi:hypothetical protein
MKNILTERQQLRYCNRVAEILFKSGPVRPGRA